MTPDEMIRAAGADRPVLIAGPTASGKSALALALARRQGGVIVNADALQVFANWRVLTARPSDVDEAAAPHRLYGHVPGEAAYSVGHWLREVAPLLTGARPIIVGGTGLYFTALTEGLAEIPPTPPQIRAEAERLRAVGGIGAMLADIDPETAARIDRQNPMRVQRAWEVRKTTGRGLAAWQDDTGPPLLPAAAALCLVADPGREALGPRIAARFDAMLAAGALDEVRANLPGWDPTRPSARAIGAPELVAHLRGECTLATARDRAVIATRQYAKRQRTWFRSRMKDWIRLDLPAS
ncbi:tRNA (adenosine(37)-N6)-dimethylallyltransferase MiaA [Oceaniglobus roseus]|uniref:tRNA (adenosine(37)-N6)-dimethylallyltransferase MiaA n=1 Tax=Oceaniglobus roseus TaxID=1737570 RepID=UPI0015621EF5|nr:tRNA (adenosine(37)-N6)-dimethylallyltransferase MiaA [Kandeliimicrobium roseum]